MEPQMDAIDCHILFVLLEDARNTSVPEIAETLEVTPATIRNRIQALENAGIIQGYHAEVDFELASQYLQILYVCNAPLELEEGLKDLRNQIGDIPNVIRVQELMTGQRNLHILAVIKDTADIRRTAADILELNIEIKDMCVTEGEKHYSYEPYGLNS
jgi:DNA-binding Lrp family transcriptional regulator